MSLNVYGESYELTESEKQLLLQAYKSQVVEKYDAKKQWPKSISDTDVPVKPVVKEPVKK